MVKNGFVKKNVGTLTLGERLNKVRSEKRIPLNEASKSTKIQQKYLEYLETGRYDKLPADVYVKGFLRSYGQYLGLDEKLLIRLYEREKEIHKNVQKEEPQKKAFSPIKFSNLVITPKFMVAILIVFFIGLGFFYLYRELSTFISSPRLIIMEPIDNFVTEEKTVKVEGETEKDSKLYLNNQQIIVDENGKFSENLILQPGLNTINIRSVNRFDKSSEKIITGEAKIQKSNEEMNPEMQSQEGEGDNEADKEKTLKLDVYGDTKPALVIIRADEEEIFRGQVSPGMVKNFEAREKISISVDKGKYIGVRLDGRDLGILSKDTKPLNRVFVPEEKTE
jgi:cytoskeletal protein RodZ